MTTDPMQEQNYREGHAFCGPGLFLFVLVGRVCYTIATRAGSAFAELLKAQYRRCPSALLERPGRDQIGVRASAERVRTRSLLAVAALHRRNIEEAL